MLVAPTEGVLPLIKQMLGVGNGMSFALLLFTNDVTPGQDTVKADLTEPSPGSGYQAQNVMFSASNVTASGGVATATPSRCDFTFTEQVTVYGYAVFDLTGGVILWAERFSDAPVTIAPGPFSMTPQVKLD